MTQPQSSPRKYAGRYLADSEINAMAEYACNSYEFTCDWKAAYFAAKEYCEDEFGFTPNKSAIALAVNKAKLKWEGFRIQAQKANQ